jgi:hypothetical protein
MLSKEELEELPYVKQTVRFTPLSIQRSNPIRYRDIKNFQFEDEDVIISEYVEPYDNGDHAGGDYFIFEVTREREETDEELSERIKRNLKFKEERRLKDLQLLARLKAKYE